MISMSVMTTNDNVPQSLYTSVKTGLFDKQDCKQYETEDCFIGNSIFDRLGDEKYNLNDSSNSLQPLLSLSNESSVSLMDTKECHVVMPKLNKSLDVHLNKTKTINLKRLQVLVAKNVIRKDSVSLDMLPKKSVAQVVMGKNSEKESEETKIKHNQSLSECSDVLNNILEKVSLRNVAESATNLSLKHEQSDVERIVDELSSDEKIVCNGRSECELVQMSKRDFDLEAFNQNSTEVTYNGKIITHENDICSNSSDYVSLKLSSDSDSDQEEEETVNQCVEDSLLTITKQNFILDWLDTDRLPTPSPPPTIVDGQYSGKKDIEFNKNLLEQNYTNGSISHELAVQLVPIDANHKIAKENVTEVIKNNTAVYVKSKTVEGNDKQSEEMLGHDISIVPEQISTDKANSEQKITPLKLYLKDIQKANSAKVLIKLIKKFNRLTVKDQVAQSIDNSGRSDQIDKESPSVVIYATVDSNCVIENVEFTGEKSKTVDSVEESNLSDKETDESTSKTKDEKQNYQKYEKLSLEVLESKVDEVSRNFQFDLEDSISFKKSAFNLLSNEKVNTRKRKRYEPHHIHRKSNKKQLKDDVNVKSIHKDNESEDTDNKSEDTDNGLKILSSDSDDEYKKETTDEEFCPSGSDFSDNKTSGKKCNTRRQGSKTSTICQESKDSSLEDKTLNYKKMLRKRQSINFVDEIYSDDDFEDDDIPNPIESKRRKNKKEKADGKILLNTSTNSTPISSVASICETSAITATVEDTSTAIDVVNAECPTITEEIATKDDNNSTNCEVILDSPLDLSKKVPEDQIENTDIKESSNNKLFLLKPTIMEDKKPEATQIKPKSTEDKQKNNSEEENKKMDNENLRQRINKCIENNYHTYLNQQEKNPPINPPYSMPTSLVTTFPFAIYSAEHFKTEYQRLRTELATLDFVAEQKERERNNILQLKRHRLAAMHQLQLRKELLSKATKTQSLNNSLITTTTTTTTTTTQPFIISTASLHCTNERYQIPTSSPAAHLSTATEVTSSLRPNGVIVRPIVVKATPNNHPVMPLRPKCNSGYSPGILLANQTWPRNVVPMPNNSIRHSLSSVQTIISKASENFGIHWVNDNRSSPLMPTVQQQIASITAQKTLENVDKLSANSQSITVINQQTKLRSDTLVAANMQLPEGYRTSTLAHLLSNNQNCNKLSTQRKIAPRWPTCQSCQNQMARYICAGCNKQWYCSEKCQIADWKSHFKTCKK